jgi:hypothetical protein
VDKKNVYLKELRVRDRSIFLISTVAAPVVVVIVQRRIVKVVVVVVVYVVVVFHRITVIVKTWLCRKKVLERKLKLELVVLGEEVLVRLALTTTDVR